MGRGNLLMRHTYYIRETKIINPAQSHQTFNVLGAATLGFVNRAAPFAGPTGCILPMTFSDDGKDGAKTAGADRARHAARGCRSSRSAPPPLPQRARALLPAWGPRDLEGDAPSPTCQSRSWMLTVCASPDRCCGARSTDDDESIYFPIETGC